MVLRELFHKARRPNHGAAFGVLLLFLALAACTSANAVPSSGDETDGDSNAVPTAERETSEAGAYPPAGYAWVIFGADTVLAEVAASAEERQQGLMYRDDVPDGTGMLFVFQDNQPRAFWMANTYVPLDIAYMNPSYTIVDVIQMEPLVTDSYPSSQASMFALEVRQGWFAENGIGVGSTASIVFGVRGR